MGKGSIFCSVRMHWTAYIVQTKGFRHGEHGEAVRRKVQHALTCTWIYHAFFATSRIHVTSVARKADVVDFNQAGKRGRQRTRVSFSFSV